MIIFHDGDDDYDSNDDDGKDDNNVNNDDGKDGDDELLLI
jgi:hypothetical protein